jgi:hypothetical protein
MRTTNLSKYIAIAGATLLPAACQVGPVPSEAAVYVAPEQLSAGTAPEMPTAEAAVPMAADQEALDATSLQPTTGTRPTVTRPTMPDPTLPDRTMRDPTMPDPVTPEPRVAPHGLRRVPETFEYVAPRRSTPSIPAPPAAPTHEEAAPTDGMPVFDQPARDGMPSLHGLDSDPMPVVTPPLAMMQRLYPRNASRR